MFHLCAYSQNFNAAGLFQVDGVNDPVMAVHGKNIQVPDYASYLLGAYTLGISFDSVQLRSPSLRRLTYYEVLPTHQNEMYSFGDYVVLNPESPVQLDVGEQINAYIKRNSNIESRNTVLMFLCDGEIKPVVTPYESVRVTVNVTTQPHEWTNAQVNLDTALPVGEYAVLGAGFWGYHLLAYRFVFQDQPARPGGFGLMNSSAPKYYYFSGGRLGVWGKFHSSTPPTVDLFCRDVDNVIYGYIDIARLS